MLPYDIFKPISPRAIDFCTLIIPETYPDEVHSITSHIDLVVARPAPKDGPYKWADQTLVLDWLKVLHLCLKGSSCGRDNSTLSGAAFESIMYWIWYLQHNYLTEFSKVQFLLEQSHQIHLVVEMFRMNLMLMIDLCLSCRESACIHLILNEYTQKRDKGDHYPPNVSALSICLSWYL